MNTRVLTPVIEEIADAALWFDSQAPGLGSEFWQLVDRSLATIEENPHRFAKSEFATPDIDLRFPYVDSNTSSTSPSNPQKFSSSPSPTPLANRATGSVG